MATFVAKMSFGLISDYIDSRLAIGIGEFLFLLALFAYVKADSYPLLVAGNILQGLGSGALTPLSGLVLARLFGVESVGRAMGLLMMIMMPWNLLATPLYGWIYDHTGSYRFAFMYCMVLVVILMTFLVRIRTHPAPVPAV